MPYITAWRLEIVKFPRPFDVNVTCFMPGIIIIHGVKCLWYVCMENIYIRESFRDKNMQNFIKTNLSFL